MDEFELSFKDLNLDEVIKNRRDVVLSGVLSRYGRLNSVVQYKADKFIGKGQLLDAEFLFSKNSFREIQKIDQVLFSFDGNGEAMKVSIDGMNLQDGDFEGTIQLNSKESFKKSTGRVTVHKIQFRPKIYELTLGAQPAEIRAYGKFALEGQSLKDWFLMIATPKLISKAYDLSALKAQGRQLKDGDSELRITVAEGALQEDSVLLNWLRPTLLEQEWPAGLVSFSELSVRLNFEPDRLVRWTRGYARLKSRWQFSTEGTFDRNKKVSGWMQWDRPDRKFLKWNYAGDFFDGAWEPQTQWVQSWLDQKNQFLQDYPAIKYKSKTQKDSTSGEDKSDS